MTVATGAKVLELLAQRKTVAWVVDATQWPRRNVLTVASRAGLLHNPDTDLVARVADEGGDVAADLPAPRHLPPPPAPPGRCSHSQLLEWAAARGNSTARGAGERVAACLIVIGAQRRREQEREQAKADRERAREQAAHLELQLARARATAAGRRFDEDAWRAARSGRSAGRVVDYDARTVRTWARQAGLDVPATGRYLPAPIVAAWRAAHPESAAS